MTGILEISRNFLSVIGETGANLWEMVLILIDCAIPLLMVFAVVWCLVKVYNSVGIKEKKK